MCLQGIHEKQSSCLFQAKTAQSIVKNNLCFDIPRAGFNLNDGFGVRLEALWCPSLRGTLSLSQRRLCAQGGHNISHNLLFQTCGESGDQ